MITAEQLISSAKKLSVQLKDISSQVENAVSMGQKIIDLTHELQPEKPQPAKAEQPQKPEETKAEERPKPEETGFKKPVQKKIGRFEVEVLEHA